MYKSFRCIDLDGKSIEEVLEFFKQFPKDAKVYLEEEFASNHSQTVVPVFEIVKNFMNGESNV